LHIHLRDYATEKANNDLKKSSTGRAVEGGEDGAADLVLTEYVRNTTAEEYFFNGQVRSFLDYLVYI
jgi:ABC-type tungstate transport system permease subunit